MTVNCVVCGEPIESDFALHHWLVKRNAVSPKNHHLVDVPENLVPMHNQSCHLPHGQSRDVTVKCLDYAARRLTARAIADWYIALWREHGISVPTGRLVPPKDYPLHRGRGFYEVGWRLLGQPPQKQLDQYDIRDVAFAKWSDQWKAYRGKVGRVDLSLAIDCVEEGYYYQYLRSVI